jgi:hypothetical protein
MCENPFAVMIKGAQTVPLSITRAEEIATLRDLGEHASSPRVGTRCESGHGVNSEFRGRGDSASDQPVFVLLSAISCCGKCAR